jgi:deoxyribonuclease-4
MKSIKGIYFGPAGVPHSAKKKDTVNGIQRIVELNLNAMELEFVYGVKLNEDQAIKANEIAKSNGVVLTAHAPYYINLNGKDEAKLKNSIRFIVESARALHLAGGYSVCFHPGWYQKMPKDESFLRVKNSLKLAMGEIKEAGYDVWIRPETMEMESKFGSLEEVIKLSQEIEGVLPCVDFAHLRYRNHWNTKAKFKATMEKLEKSLGKDIIKNMHVHISGIKLDKAGTHVNLSESDLKWKDILKVIKEFNVEGVIICESPNLEEDALLLKNYYESLEEASMKA